MLCTQPMPDAWSRAYADAVAFLQMQWPWQGQEQNSVVALPQMDKLSDEACVVLYQQGDTAAFRALYFRYRDKLHRYVLRLVSRVSEAEEVFQEAWVTVIRSSTPTSPVVHSPHGFFQLRIDALRIAGVH